MTMSEHPDAEGLSAYFDGEAPELADHVAGCDTCRAEVERLEALSANVGAPVPALDPGAVDAMIGEAMAASPASAADELAPLRARRDTRRWIAAASVAAVIVVAVGLAGVLSRGGGGERNAATQSASGPAAAPTSGAKSDAAAGATNLLAPSEVTGSDDTAINGGDLGDIADSSQLASRVGPTLGAAAVPGDNPVVAPSAAADSGPAPRARAVGTRACEPEVRTIDPGAGALVYVANATQGGAPATVLGFAPPGGGRPISLFLMAQDGCRLLATATLP
jgi:hypothetical protein